MTERVWNDGPPPHVGWWNASANKFGSIWRWWDGAHWSKPAFQEMSAEQAGEQAVVHAASDDIPWIRRWPEGARVPRVNPESP